MSQYLEKAINSLHEGTRLFNSNEAGRVFHEFASFCDQQLKNPDNIEDYQRALKLRENKQTEIREIEELMKTATGAKFNTYSSFQNKAKVWLKLDDLEFGRLQDNREAFLEKSISNYLRCLEVCDTYDGDAVRFCALWLEYSSNPKANQAAKCTLESVPSRKFVSLMSQLSSRLLDADDEFQKLLSPLIIRITREHPYHALYQLMALTKIKNKDRTSESRHKAAIKVAGQLKREKSVAHIMHRVVKSIQVYHSLAMKTFERQKGRSKYLIRSVLPEFYRDLEKEIPGFQIPPPTMNIEIRPDCDYTHVPHLLKFQPEVRIAAGASAPKIIGCQDSAGQFYKMLVKGGNDDLRQDAIMEQVFEQVSHLLQKNRPTRQRNLTIRAYKVVPLTTSSGIIEFVLNTIPLHDYLLPAHDKYYPSDWKANKCRQIIYEAQQKTRNERVKAYREVMAKFSPVMRYFFMHNFNGPDEWFRSRLAYTRSTAAISILGHVLGLGDRHGHNILLDERTGEVVHIDLGVAFEQGRVLPVPEVVPFRLTRDIVDGMGITKTEGVFRRCCEFTLSVLREESYNITTILDVLRYDPLYSWTISPLRMQRMQANNVEVKKEEAGVSSENNKVVAEKKNNTAQKEESEAERALMVVSKKLSKTLSVSATVNELIQQATDERNLAVLYCGWAAFA